MFLQSRLANLVLAFLETQVSEESGDFDVVSLKSLEYLYLDYAGEERLEPGGMVVSVDVQDTQ